MTKEQLGNGNDIMSNIKIEKFAIRHLDELRHCVNVVIIPVTEEVQNALDRVRYSLTAVAPVYIKDTDVDRVVNALVKPRQERITQLQKEFDEL